MLIDSKSILSYLPHRAPFVMVSNLLKVAEDQFETDFLVERENIFVADGMLTESALIENIAQTCACGFSYLGQENEAQGRVGYIGSVSKLILHELPPVNSRIITKATVTHHLGNIFVIKGENFLNGKILLECEMKIVVQ